MLQRREILSWIALVLVVAYDCLAVLGRRSDWDYWKYWVLGDIALLLLLGLAGWMSGIKFKPRTSLIKLLANTTGVRVLNVLYLFLFAFNFAGLSSAILPLFQPEVKFVNAIYPLGVLAIVLMGLIFFFPGVRDDKNDDAEYVFISGISFINRFDRAQVYDSFKLNLVPLVRMLQLCVDTNQKRLRKCQFLIVLSDAFKSFDIKVNDTLKDVMHVVCPEKENEIDLNKGVDNNLRLLIREVAKKEFPTDKYPLLVKQIEIMKINFTQACNYNGDFDTVYARLDEKATPLDDSNHILYFNLTPGTGIIGGLMTLQAIDGDRELYYYSQKSLPEDIKDNPDAIEEFKKGLLNKVPKSQIPLKNLLSQALESELSAIKKV